VCQTIKQRTLERAYHYFEIAQICRTAEQSDEALEWAEKGVQAFPKYTDSRQLDFLAEIKLRHKPKRNLMKLLAGVTGVA
jgi:hypothetical protein